MTGWRSIPLSRLPPRLQLEPGALHVWSVPLTLPECSVDRAASLLSVEDRERAVRFVRPQDRRRFIVAHAALRILLSRYTEIPIHELFFLAGPHGKPALAGVSPHAISFNMAHSGERAIIAVSTCELGVDVEELRFLDDADSIARSFFAPAEVAALAAAPDTDGSGFLICWTRKEAFIKAVGGGLSIGLDSFEVSVLRDRPAILRIGDEGLRARPWSMVHLQQGMDYVGAAVVAGPIARLELAQLDLDPGAPDPP
jgi:4'-phosphopantetheinyl transferase